MNPFDVIRAVSHNRDVEILVTSCCYTCCGGGWRARSGYEQTYVGRVVSWHTTGDHPYFILQSRALGKITRILVEHEHLVEARIKEDGA